MNGIKFAIILFSLLQLRGFSQDSVVVKLNLADCHNCFGGFCTMERFPDNLNPTIIVKEMDRKIAGKFIRNTLGLKHQYLITYSDSLYKIISQSISSEVFVYRNKELILKTKLSDFSLTLPEKLLNRNVIWRIPDSIQSNKVLKYFITGNYIIIQDLVFNEIHLFDYKQNVLIKSFNSNSFNIDTIYEIVNLDSTSKQLFNKSKSSLKLTRNDVPIIDGCQIKEGKIYITGTYPVLSKSRGDTILLLRKNFLVISSLHDLNCYRLKMIPEFTLDSVKYFPELRNFFVLSDTALIFRSISSNESSPYNLSLWKVSDKKTHPYRLLSKLIPDYYVKTGLKMNLLTEFVAWPFLIYSLAPMIKNMQDGVTKPLPFSNDLFTFNFNDFENHKFNFIVYDVIYNSGLLKILFLDHENQFIVIEIDPKSLDIKKTTFFPKGILSPTANVVFFDNDNVSSISENGEIFKTSF